MRVDMYMLNKKLDELLNRQRLEEFMKFRAVDYTEYIKTDLKQFTVIWKYDGKYFKNKNELFNRVVKEQGYDKSLRTFQALLDNPARQEEMWDYKIQMIFAIIRPKINYYLTCEGWLLTKNKLSWVRKDPYNSYFKMIIDGEYLTFNRAYNVYKLFIDPSYDEKPYHIDGFYGNCGVDNLIRKWNEDEAQEYND